MKQAPRFPARRPGRAGDHRRKRCTERWNLKPRRPRFPRACRPWRRGRCPRGAGCRGDGLGTAGRRLRHPLVEGARHVRAVRVREEAEALDAAGAQGLGDGLRLEGMDTVPVLAGEPPLDGGGQAWGVQVNVGVEVAHRGRTRIEGSMAVRPRPAGEPTIGLLRRSPGGRARCPGRRGDRARRPARPRRPTWTGRRAVPSTSPPGRRPAGAAMIP
jgi:hypothetical protein